VANLTTLHEELVSVVLVGRPLAEVLGDITSIARRALDADELQYARDYGPCVDAGRSGQVFLIDDMRTDDRWPDYTRHAAERGIGSSLSVPLPFQAATLGALDNYSSRPHAFGEEDVELASTVAPWIAYAVNNASGAASATEETANMLAAMATRAGIEQAKGILMERHRLTPDQAFNLLTKASQHTGIKLREVADELVRTGALPGAR